MPIRKKHVRRLLVAALVLVTVGPAVGLLVVGLSLRGGAYDRAVEERLTAALRCEARVRGAKPTGLDTAAADTVDLAWAAGDGRLTLRLAGLSAERNQFGWYVRAAEGTLTLAGRDTAATLAALNQRLVQAGQPPLMSLVIERLKTDLTLGGLKVLTESHAVALSNGQIFTVQFFDPAIRKQAAGEAESLPVAVLRLNPTSGLGVFGGFHLEEEFIRPVSLLRLFGLYEGADKPVPTYVSVSWRWPGDNAEVEEFRMAACGTPLIEWTGCLPRGQLQADGRICVRHVKKGDTAPSNTLVEIEGLNGTISTETLRWLGGLPGLATLAPAGSDRLTFSDMRVRLEIVGSRAWFVGDTDATGLVPLVSCRALGRDIPILWGSPREFDAAALWRPLAKALREE